ncbi:helix-turn-helix domain-containing protein [Paenibacillus sp. IB182496]|uniref:Helix-turn-helix domain-containing protein n=1 Tax=Paenibacillus sabuli TaxID=2772509 RepID=A0A927GQA9_9BACL|nr:helix-turn-helix domain-containing protein [Paenibacillus sabuli]MBD2844188.1 helix-turn-helix domain-containing protein [Paenibacillus sabuli]
MGDIGAGHRRITPLPPGTQPLPLYVDSIGNHPEQEAIRRPEGFPGYHWLETSGGEGRIVLGGDILALPPRSGVLILPGVPHRYEAALGTWGTMYLTFGGPLAAELLRLLRIERSMRFTWRTAPPFSLLAMLDEVARSRDLLGQEASSLAYRFLLQLGSYAAADAPGQGGGGGGDPERLRPLIAWMEERLADPAIRLEDLCAAAGLSARRLGDLFRVSLGLSPYSYLLHLRIRRAKALLVRDSNATVADIAAACGFRDASHFIAVFRRHTSMTPLQYRRLQL